MRAERCVDAQMQFRARWLFERAARSHTSDEGFRYCTCMGTHAAGENFTAQGAQRASRQGFCLKCVRAVIYIMPHD